MKCSNCKIKIEKDKEKWINCKTYCMKCFYKEKQGKRPLPDAEWYKLIQLNSIQSKGR